MADKLFFSRDVKVFIDDGTNSWTLPVLDGFSFSQATNTSEITLNEMASSTGVSRRGRQMFTDSYAPAEWSFSTYVRPFVSTTSTAAGTADSAAKTHAVEEVLWANMTGTGLYGSYAFNQAASGGQTGTANWNNGDAATGLTINWTKSNVTTLGTFDIYFLLSKDNSTSAAQLYKLSSCCVNEASIDFDIDGIATINWSGMGQLITEVEGGVIPRLAASITEGGTSANTSNFIRNRLTSLSMTAANSSLYPGVNSNGVYNAVLTGGNLTFSNNMTYLTPETLGIVNQPIGHVTGTRTIGGNFTCYLNSEAGSTADLFEDIIENTDDVTNDFNLVFSIGGTTSATPRLIATLPNCHLEVPSHSMDDVISLEVNFHALPGAIDSSDEASLKYLGTAL